MKELESLTLFLIGLITIAHEVEAVAADLVCTQVNRRGCHSVALFLCDLSFSL